MGSIVKGIGKALGFSEPERPDYSKAISAAQFKPYSLTTGFGRSTFDTKAGTGTYTLDPRLAAMRDVFYGAATSQLPSTTEQDFTRQLQQEGMGLFSRASGRDINQMAQDYLNRQLDILAPGRAQEESRLADTLFKTGRTGAAVGYGAGYVNPEQFALLSAREQANAQLGLNALDRARAMQAEDQRRALGLVGTANELEMQPYTQANTLFGLGTNLEQLGAGTLTGGFQAGQMASGANQNVAQLLGAQEDARVRYANDPGFWGSLVAGGIRSFANPLSNFSWGSSAGSPSSMFNLGSSGTYYSPSYGNNASRGIVL